MQIKNTVRYYLLPVRMTVIKKTKINSEVDAEKWGTLNTVGEDVK